MESIVNYYQMIDEGSRFSRNSRRIEFLTSTYVLNQILPQRAKILDVGAGTGVYSFYYAERGHKVTAVDITPKHIDEIKNRSDETKLEVKAYVENATDLSRFESETFDCVMCFGPLYHIIDDTERDKCLKECLRVLKSSGHLAIAYINKYSIIPMLTTRTPQFIRPSVVNKVINNGVILDGDEDCFWTDAYFTSPKEIEGLLMNYGVRTVDHVGTDGISHTIQDSIDNLGENEFNTWLDYHFQTCRERSILGISSHGLYICQKN
ncbi:class I SAM-dependent methyltransferase [Alicyclobacillus fastidiosus]|uniref:Class I SAM-dependent methyltransferase n=1 Tax=Alicyclobacillus fastidiosus TaxID=392011 RepID=A0ABY6ZJ93_9BACL|nr:class I SAM-dependent methyltransferase [Alicyclobacillus fastidiosus]WAH42988.1 class I SAM-dependent methyltransferase [Alicyclobacillus fastidiosus]GMA64956.1 SAM-dependent methyltransferase [Alicyclobacillus fastidiosus]